MLCSKSPTWYGRVSIAGPTIPQHLQKGQESAKGQSACDQPGWTPTGHLPKEKYSQYQAYRYENVIHRTSLIGPALSQQSYRTSLGEGRLAIIYIPIEDCTLNHIDPQR
jgi:hypothetical protein